MSIGISSDHVELASTLAKWAEGENFLDAVREAETRADEPFDAAWESLAEMGLATIALPESVGGGGGTVLDAAVALEACARSMAPGHLLSTTVAGALLAHDEAGREVTARIADGARVALAPTPGLTVGERLTGTVEVVWDAPGADLFLLGAQDGSWHLVPAEFVQVTGHVSLDLTRRTGSVTVDAPLADAVGGAGAVRTGLDTDTVRRAAVTFAAAELAGVARWALATAVDYAGVREQFGRPIGSFQAIKHLCAEMLEDCEQITAVAWDAASVAFTDTEQWAFAVDVAGTVAFDAAVRVTQAAIQVLGGIGFTFEHEAHFYLRRAVLLRNLVGSGYGASLAERAATGLRRRIEVDLDGRDEAVRPGVRETVAGIVAADDQRAALVDS